MTRIDLLSVSPPSVFAVKPEEKLLEWPPEVLAEGDATGAAAAISAAGAATALSSTAFNRDAMPPSWPVIAESSSLIPCGSSSNTIGKAGQQTGNPKGRMVRRSA